MKPVGLPPLAPAAREPGLVAQPTLKGDPAQAQKAPDPQVLKAAREFEAIFLRTLLGPLEKTTQLGSKSGLSAGQSTFGGMVVSAVADSVSSVGGIGLADVIARALAAKGAEPSGNSK